MKHKPVKSGTLFERGLIHRVVTQGVFVAMLTLAAYYIGASHSHSTGQTMAFCVLAFSQMLRAFNQRSNTEYIWVRAEGHVAVGKLCRQRRAAGLHFAVARLAKRL